MLNTFRKVLFVIILSFVVLLVGGCGSQSGDIAPIEPKAETVSETATPRPTATLPTAPVSPVSPVSPISDAIMSKLPLKGSEKALTAAVADLSEQAEIAPDEISLVAMEAVDWSDASLGCPEEGFMYAQVITPGYLIVLEADGEEYQYHTDQQGNSVALCEKE